jgi:hypothetical protein
MRGCATQTQPQLHSELEKLLRRELLEGSPVHVYEVSMLG